MLAMRAVINAVDFAVPGKRMSNDEFPASLDTSDEWIRSHTGIGYRHIADPSVASSDLAYEACRKVLEKTATAAEEIDLVIVATATPDFIGFPSVSCIVQDRLGAKNAGAMDLAAGCTGFIYALETARGFVVSGGARKVLVAGADVLTGIPVFCLAMGQARRWLRLTHHPGSVESSDPCFGPMAQVQGCSRGTSAAPVLPTLRARPIPSTTSFRWTAERCTTSPSR